jgi:NADH dehydrogenase FAD-containing subunit
VVIVGAGFGGLQVAKTLAHAPVQVTNMRGLGSGSFDPKTLAIVEAAFDEA